MKPLLSIPLFGALAWGQAQVPTTGWLQGPTYTSSNTCQDAGSTDDYACTLTTTAIGYVVGQLYRFKANTANTGAATINFSSFGVKSIVKPVGGVDTALDTNDIRSGQWVNLVWDATNFQMLSQLGNSASATIPSGLITLSLTTCASGYSEVAALNGKMLRGTVSANGDVGTTGGNATITPSGTVTQPTLTMNAYTPAGTNAAPVFTGTQGTVPAETFTGSSGTVPAEVFTGSALATHTHTLTATGTNGTVSFTPTGTIAWPASVPAFTGTQGSVPAEVISWPAGVPTFSGSALATHTHTGGTLADATSGATVKLFTSSASGVSAATLSGSTGATSGGTPAGTVAWPAGVPTTATATFTPVGTIAWPASVPAFTGASSTVPAETFTGSSATSSATSAGTPAGTNATTTFTPTGTNSTAVFTPAGTNSAPAFTGTQSTLTGTVSQPTFTGSAVDPSPAYVKVIFCAKN